LTFQIGQLNDDQFQLELSLSAANAESLGVAAASVGIDSVASAQAAMDAIDTAIDSINQYMAKVGAYQNRLQYTIENLEWEVMNFTKNQILQQSGIAMLAQANMAPQQILQLLG